MRFFVGVPEPSWLESLVGCISIARLVRRKSLFPAKEWIIDSAAYGDLHAKGVHRSVASYVETIERSSPPAERWSEPRRKIGYAIRSSERRPVSRSKSRAK